MSDEIEWLMTETIESTTRVRLMVAAGEDNDGKLGAHSYRRATRADLLKACEVAGMSVVPADLNVSLMHAKNLADQRDEALRRLEVVERERDELYRSASAAHERIKLAIGRLRESFRVRPDCALLEHAVEDACADARREAESYRQLREGIREAMERGS